MNVTLNMPIEQIDILAEKLGYQAKVEDMDQPMVGDSYPLIDNPVSLEQFVNAAVNEFLVERVQGRLREEIKIIVQNLHNQAQEKISKGDYDNDLMALDTSTVLQKVISELIVG